MTPKMAHVALVVRDYDEAIAYYTDVLGFDLIEGTYQPEEGKRWVVVRPNGGGCSLILVRASKQEQDSFVRNQAGGRVFLFLQTDDFWRDYEAYKKRGVVFERDPNVAESGTVAVFQDLYGNLWDLIEFAARKA
ncbi:VOC family protein [Epibacterium ulvae]|uniref:VOC family protein n=1 Tax=Epibacterium ulvae TaxID=1156985 RepID=UPI00249159D6|nr:VOC family protein [Epibacterium ulvae]